MPLSDAEVFGGAPASQPLSDADVFGAAPKPISDTDAGLTPDYFNAPRVSEAPAPSVSDLITHPIVTGSRLLDYAKERAGYTSQHSILNTVANLAGDAGYKSDMAAAGVASPGSALAGMRQAQRENAPLKPRGFLEGIAGFGGDMASSIADPTSYFMPEYKGLSVAGHAVLPALESAAHPVLAAMGRHAIGGAAAGAVVDPVTQGGNMLRGQQDGYSPLQTLGTMGTYATLGIVPHAIGDVHEALTGADRGLNAAIPAYEPPDLSGATTVDALWPHLVRQESGGDQGAVSSKGATGAAQLMPDTARYMANKIGRPELADIALEDTTRGKMANQYLGKLYLGEQLDRFDDPAVALAAYNAGPARAAEWLQRFGHPDAVGRGAWIDQIPFKETRDYVRSVLGKAAPAEGELAPHQQAASAEAMQSHLEDGGYVPNTERAAQAMADPQEVQKAVQTITDAAQNPTGKAAADLKKQLDDFAGSLDQPAAEPVAAAPAPETEIPGEKIVPPPQSDFPGDWGREAAPEPAAASPADVSITDQALDHIRNSTTPRLGEGPSLIEALVKNGGLRDQGGELSNVLGGAGEDRLLKMLRRVNKGRTLDEAAQWAQERGYIGAHDLEARATPDDLLEAIRREVAGEKQYPADKINHEGRLLQDHMSDLEHFMSELDVDPKTHTNAEIQAAMDEHFRKAGEPDAFLSEADKANAARMKEEEFQRHLDDWEAGRGHEPMEAGGLWDETRRGEQDLWDGDILGMGEGDGTALSPEAQRVAQRHAIYASTKGTLRAERKVGAVPVTGAVTPVEATFADIWRQLKESLDVPVRQGRLGMRKALGTYNRKSGVVRVAGVHDVAVEVHELAHAMEFTKKYPSLLAEMAKNSKLLRSFDYDQKALRRHEGFAEWVRWYVTNPDYARQVAPNFYDAFERAVGHDAPDVLTALQDAQRQYGAFLSAPSLASAASSIAHREQPGMIRSFLNIATSKDTLRGGLGQATNMAWQEAKNEVYRGLIDHLHPWEQAVQGLLDTAERNGVQMHLLAANNPVTILRQVPAVYAAGHMDLIHGVHPYHGLDPSTSSLAQALELALGDGFKAWDKTRGGLADQFDAYLISRRVRHDYDRMNQPGGLTQPPDQYSRDYHEQIVADAERLHPEWEKAAEMIYDWNAGLWQKRFDAGFLTPEDFQHGIDNNPDYVPLYRDLSDTRDAPGGAHGLNSKYAGGARKRKGSTRAYLSPVESMMHNAYELNGLIARNDALRALDDLAQVVGPDASRIAERLPKTVMKATRVGIEEVLDSAAREIGVNPVDHLMAKQMLSGMFGEDAKGTVFRAQDAPERGEPILHVWRDGESIPIRLPDGKWGQHMVEAFSGMTPPMRSTLFNFFTYFARLQRMTTTMHPGFLVANSLRDQMTASALTDVGYRAFVDQMEGLKHELGQTDTARRYNVVGGAIGGMQSAAEREARLKADINVLRSKGIQLRHFANWQAVARVAELSETGTRMGLFDRGVQHFQKEGMPDWEAHRESGAMARDYMDFDRHGAWPGVRGLARLVPFANAAMQAVDKVRRVGSGITARNTMAERLFGRPPATREEQTAFDAATKLFIGSAMLATASLSWRALMKDNPEYDEISDYTRDTAWVVPLGGMLMGAVPKPYEIAAPGNALERVYEGTTQHDPTAWGRLAQGLATNLMPNLMPTALEVKSDLDKNRDSFGAPIVPDSMTNVDPQFQYTDRTSQIGKVAGKITSPLPKDFLGMDWRASPAKVDFIVKSLFSSMGREALNATNQLGRAPIGVSLSDAPVFNRFVKDWTRGARSTKEFYSLVSGSSGEWSGGVASVQKLMRDGDTAAAAHYVAQMDPQKRAYTVLQLVGEGGLKDIHPMTRAQSRSSVMQGMAFNLQQGDPLMITSHGAQPLALTPVERRQAVDALHALATSEQRNAMVVSNVPGWSQRQPLPYDKYMGLLAKASPALPQILSERMAISDPHQMPAAQTYGLWNQIAPKLAALDEAHLKALLDEKNSAGMAGILRVLEKPIPVK